MAQSAEEEWKSIMAQSSDEEKSEVLGRGPTRIAAPRCCQ